MPTRKRSRRSKNKSKRRPTLKQSGGAAKGRVFVMYHIFCNSLTEGIVKEQILSILFSGLYDRADTIYCFLTGEPAQIPKIEGMLKKAGRKFKIQAKGPNDTTYERFTLLKIHDLIQDDDKFLYIHSKGVTRLDDSIYWWRFYMEWYLMRNIQGILDTLNTYDIAGVLYRENVIGTEATMVGPHFSGNFWWARGSYYQKLDKTIGSGYNDTETYVFSKDPKYKMLDGKPLGARSFYHDPIYPSEYL